MAKNRLNIAVIPGDGIGKEVIPEGLRVLQAAMERFDINLNFDHFDFASYDYYAKHGQMMPMIGKHKSAIMMPSILALLAGLTASPTMFLYGDP